ncbi:hypothetical protein [Actinomadura sp. 3N407]|uniref:hypothetical protein n=1 Tax=Actinomadura sp. 3N407 TaxID=3457423 RepID=UPI003FCD8C49
MRPHSRIHHRRACAAIFAAALMAPAFIAAPARADDCKGGDPFSCKQYERGNGSGGQGGSSGGGNSGPVEPPDPVDLTENEAVGFVPIEGDPAPAAATTLDWVAAAESSARLPAPVVHTAPDGKTYVRMRTSLWVDGFEVVRTEPIGDDGQSIQATANPVSVTWNMGEAQKKCEDAGSKEGKSCNYTYQRSSAGQPAGAYQITATITWHLTWTCEGPACDPQGGDLGPESVTSQPAPLVVSEIQTNTGQ